MFKQNIYQEPNKDQETTVDKLVEKVFRKETNLSPLTEHKDEDIKSYIEKKLTQRNLKNRLKPISKKTLQVNFKSL